MIYHTPRVKSCIMNSIWLWKRNCIMVNYLFRMYCKISFTLLPEWKKKTDCAITNTGASAKKPSTRFGKRKILAFSKSWKAEKSMLLILNHTHWLIFTWAWLIDVWRKLNHRDCDYRGAKVNSVAHIARVHQWQFLL